ncbi:low temperature requirement protein A [Bacillus cereus]|uniref:Low temperature requirement protein A n=1 Tax=Bacillus cereus VD184 TaxID=1053242 RepID=A0A9W5R5T4_BACCE|nr:low temperature requirement protein A [Bacillus cereus]EOQ09374.1 hypothetical protein IKC_05773 [Bacillus cereus VD184]
MYKKIKHTMQNNKVSTLELFFDLVFVFTITQLTGALTHHLHWIGFLQVFLMLALIWWMYGGYLWLTNITQIANSQLRGFLLFGMAGFLMISLAIPDAFGKNSWAFGLGYMIVNTMHSTLFVLSSKGVVRTAISSTIPLNFLNASLVLIGGIAGGDIQYIFWILAISIQILFPYIRKQKGEYHFSPHHFVERHGLVVIVAIGESIIAIGVGAEGHVMNLETTVSSIAALVLSFTLWSVYFAEDKRIERAFSNIPTAARRRQIAFNAFGYAHYIIIVGVIILAVGIKKTLHHPLHPLSFLEAFSFGFGIAVFILGNLWFHRTLLSIKSFPHIIGTLATFVTILFGMHYALLQLLSLIFIVSCIIYTNKQDTSEHLKTRVSEN